MSLSDDARVAMTLHIGCGRGWSDAVLDRLVTDALAAVLPDGRTIAQALDDGETALAAARALVRANRINREDVPWQWGSPADNLIARLEAEAR